MHNANPALSAHATAARRDPWIVEKGLVLAAVLVITVLIIIPVVDVFYLAFSSGVMNYWAKLFNNPETLSAIRLTLLVALASVGLNTVFGVVAAWLIARFRFPGRAILTALIDLPFSISPVVAGLMLVLIFNKRNGYVGPFLASHGFPVIFAWPGLVLATSFVTLPFVARELIPLMEALGPEEEMAAVSLGARSWQLFWRVTLPNIKWGLLYGVILCNARAMGEFGAVYVVSGREPGKTETMPLMIERLVMFGDNSGAFAVASLLTLLALVSLVIKVLLERQTRRQLAEAARVRVAGDES